MDHGCQSTLPSEARVAIKEGDQYNYTMCAAPNANVMREMRVCLSSVQRATECRTYMDAVIKRGVTEGTEAAHI